MELEKVFVTPKDMPVEHGFYVKKSGNALFEGIDFCSIAAYQQQNAATTNSDITGLVNAVQYKWETAEKTQIKENHEIQTPFTRQVVLENLGPYENGAGRGDALIGVRGMTIPQLREQFASGTRFSISWAQDESVIKVTPTAFVSNKMTANVDVVDANGKLIYSAERIFRLEDTVASDTGEPRIVLYLTPDYAHEKQVAKVVWRPFYIENLPLGKWGDMEPLIKGVTERFHEFGIPWVPLEQGGVSGFGLLGHSTEDYHKCYLVDVQEYDKGGKLLDRYIFGMVISDSFTLKGEMGGWCMVSFTTKAAYANSEKLSFTAITKNLALGQFDNTLQDIRQIGPAIVGKNQLTGVLKQDGPIKKFALEQNYPNPFNGTTQITYSLPKSADVSLRIYDLLGREVAILADQREDAGKHEISFNAEKYHLASGTYFLKLDAGNNTETRKMVYVK